MLVGVHTRPILLYMTHSAARASWVLDLIARLCSVLNVPHLDCVLFKSLLGLTANLQPASASIRLGLRRRLGPGSRSPAVCFG